MHMTNSVLSTGQDSVESDRERNSLQPHREESLLECSANISLDVMLYPFSTQTLT